MAATLEVSTTRWTESVSVDGFQDVVGSLERGLEHLPQRIRHSRNQEGARRVVHHLTSLHGFVEGSFQQEAGREQFQRSSSCISLCRSLEKLPDGAGFPRIAGVAHRRVNRVPVLQQDVHQVESEKAIGPAHHDGSSELGKRRCHTTKLLLLYRGYGLVKLF